MYRGNSTFLLQNMCKQLSYYPLNINGNYVVFDTHRSTNVFFVFDEKFAFVCSMNQKL